MEVRLLQHLSLSDLHADSSCLVSPPQRWKRVMFCSLLKQIKRSR